MAIFLFYCRKQQGSGVPTYNLWLYSGSGSYNVQKGKKFRYSDGLADKKNNVLENISESIKKHLQEKVAEKRNIWILL